MPRLRSIASSLGVARNSFFVLVCSLLLGALILKFYGISIPVLRAAGGFIVAVAGLKLLSEGSHKELEPPRMASRGPSCLIRPSIH